MLTLTVEGMDCGHCRDTVTRAVQAVPAVAGVSVDLATGIVVVQGEPDADRVRAAIEDQGYAVKAAA